MFIKDWVKTTLIAVKNNSIQSLKQNHEKKL